MKKIFDFLTVSKLRTFLFGIFVGQLLMVPGMHRLIVHPKVQAIPVPDSIFNEEMSTRAYIMHDVHGVETKKTELTIVLTTEKNVQQAYFNRYGIHSDTVLGFYDYTLNKIICMDSTDILIHEMRHVFEGPFHRS